MGLGLVRGEGALVDGELGKILLFALRARPFNFSATESNDPVTLTAPGEGLRFTFTLDIDECREFNPAAVEGSTL